MKHLTLATLGATVLLTHGVGCKRGPACAPAADHSVIACVNNAPVPASEVAFHLTPAALHPRDGRLPQTPREALDRAIRVRLFAVEARRRRLYAPERAPLAHRRAILYGKLVDRTTKFLHLENDGARRQQVLDDLEARLRASSRIQVFDAALAAMAADADKHKTP